MQQTHTEHKESFSFDLEPEDFPQVPGECIRLKLTYTLEDVRAEITWRNPREVHEEACGCGYVQRYTYDSKTYGLPDSGPRRGMPDWLKPVVWAYTPGWFLWSNIKEK